MIFADILLAAPNWVWPAIVLGAVSLVAIIYSYTNVPGNSAICWIAALLKVVGIVALAICLVEPLFSGTRPRKKANLFVFLTDNSKSLNISDRGYAQSRGQILASKLQPDSQWQTRLDQDFDVRRYLFDSRARPVDGFADLAFDGTQTSLKQALMSVAERYRGRPTAGILLMTDGNATDLEGHEDIKWSLLPPVYPVVIGNELRNEDIRLSRVGVSQSNFETAPVTIQAEVSSDGFAGERIVIQLLDEQRSEVERRTVVAVADEKPIVERFHVPPIHKGIHFYQVRAFLKDEEDKLGPLQKSQEATRQNNAKLVTVDRGGGPYRVLYVCGRPNWEFKFLRRALAEDDDVNLVGLVRVAKREPKFKFLGRRDERTNPFYRGFGNNDDEQAEQYDQPVLLRLGTEDAEELRDGFPTATDQLFRYHALILDDLEVGFFTQDQLSLIQQFVSRRGGGFMMLGGQESYVKGQYDRTPIGELLPVYVDSGTDAPTPAAARLQLTRAGWLEPWMRMRSTEEEERNRLSEMPEFKTLNVVRSIKPGATVLSKMSTSGTEYPAVVAQQFGRGRSAAMLIGDLWRWQLHQKDNSAERDELHKSWRQMVRWLVGDVPRRVEVDVAPAEDRLTIEMETLVRDENFNPLDNATVQANVITPDGKELRIQGEPTDTSGNYVCSFTPRISGAYKATIHVDGPDGNPVGERDAGWAWQPDTDEFDVICPNRPLLKNIAEKSGGELIELADLESFARSLPNRKVPIVEKWTYPLWHQWTVFGFAVMCLVGEWGLRRWHGLP